MIQGSDDVDFGKVGYFWLSVAAGGDSTSIFVLLMRWRSEVSGTKRQCGRNIYIYVVQEQLLVCYERKNLHPEVVDYVNMVADIAESSTESSRAPSLRGLSFG